MARQNQDEINQQEYLMTKTLIAYFSHTGENYFGGQIRSYKFVNRSLYQKARIGELPHFCNEMKKCNQ